MAIAMLPTAALAMNVQIVSVIDMIMVGITDIKKVTYMN
jgi:hypothetical protein